MHEKKNTNVRVGLFVFVAIALGSSLIFTLSDRKGLFGSKVEYEAVFSDVGGLRPGSTLRIAGVDVGQVGGVSLGEEGKIHVKLLVRSDFARLVRTDSVVSIGSKGMLGDKLVDISVGHGDLIPEGGRLASREAFDLASITAQAGTIMNSAQATVENLRAATGVLADPEFQTDIKNTMHGVSELVRLASSGDGLVHKLLDDPAFASNIESTMRNASEMTAELARTSRNARAITDEIRNGDGSAHEIIYGRAGAELAQNLATASGEAAAIMSAVRTGDGLVHQLVYEPRGGELIDNAAAMSGDMRAIMADVRAGRGTIGGFLTDPSVYEDVKRLVGNLERNEILRALVRYSIRHDEARPEANVTEQR